ncbi:MAG: hypothetical protein K6A15_09710 [Treponema sp.]|nr:hypothetical protein [Treponema sp.]
MKCFFKHYRLFIFILYDGTVIVPSDFDNYEGKAKPMAVIFSTTGGHKEESSRVLGLGLIPSEPLVFTPQESKGFITNILANQTMIVAPEFSISEGQYNNEVFFGLIDGRQSWKNIGLYDSKAKKSFADYPAYDYAVNYGSNNNFAKFKKGWYLPTASEAYELAENNELIQASLKKCGAADLQTIIWTSSQCYGAQENEFVVAVRIGEVEKFDLGNGAYACRNSKINYELGFIDIDSISKAKISFTYYKFPSKDSNSYVQAGVFTLEE